MHTQSLPPGPRGLPALRHLLALGHERKALDRFSQLQVDFGDCVGLSVGPASVILTYRPEDAKRVFKEQRAVFGRGGPLRREAFPLVGDSLVLNDQPAARQAVRTELIEALSAASLACFAHGGAADKLVTGMLDDWEVRARRDPEGSVEITSDLSSLAFAIAGQALLGTDISQHESAISDGSHAYWKRTMGRAALPLSLPNWVPTPGAIRSKRFIHGVHDAIDQILACVLAGEAEGSPIAALAEAQGDTVQARQHLREQILTLVLAAHETVYSMLCFTMHLLSNHPDVQDELVESERTIPGEPLRSSGEPDFVTRVLRESLRLYPPAPANVRVALEATQLDDYCIPKDTIIFYPIGVTQRDPRYWDEPEVFRPDRFTRQAAKEIPEFAYFPFAKGGARACVGERFAMHEGELVISRIVERLAFSPTHGGEIQKKMILNMVPADPIRLRIVPR